MEITITIPMPPVSLNNSHMVLKRGARIKKTETRLYEQEFEYHLNKFKHELNAIKEAFNEEVHRFHLNWVFLIKKERFYTKKGLIDQKLNPDLDNLIKIPQDIIFNQIGNDCFITKFTCEKRPHDKDIIQVKIKLVSKT